MARAQVTADFSFVLRPISLEIPQTWVSAPASEWRESARGPSAAPDRSAAPSTGGSLCIHSARSSGWRPVAAAGTPSNSIPASGGRPSALFSVHRSSAREPPSRYGARKRSPAFRQAPRPAGILRQPRKPLSELSHSLVFLRHAHKDVILIHGRLWRFEQILWSGHGTGLSGRRVNRPFEQPGATHQQDSR